MGTGREFEGKGLDDALRQAAEALGVPSRELTYEVLSRGRRGVFGLGARDVKIRVRVPAGSTIPQGESLEKSFARAGSESECAFVDEVLGRMIELMRIRLVARSSPMADGVRVELDGADRSMLVARNGELLDALQFLLNRMARRRSEEFGRIRLECQGYRQDRDQAIIEQVRELATEVAATGRARWLPPLNPYERRLAHLTVGEFPGLTTRSDGPGFLKKVRIGLEEPKGEA